MNIVCAVSGGGLRPLPEYNDSLEQFGDGEIVSCVIKKPRNIHLHRKFFAMIRALWELDNISNNFSSEDALRAWITIAAGHYDLMQFDGGIEARIPKSISFASMDETEFTDFYNRAVNAVLQKYLPEFHREDIDIYIDQFVRF